MDDGLTGTMPQLTRYFAHPRSYCAIATLLGAVATAHAGSYTPQANLATSPAAASSQHGTSQAVQLWQQILQMNRAANPQGMIDACLQLIRLQPTFYGGHYYLGLAAQQAGQNHLVGSAYNKALELLNAELTSNPNRHELLEVKADLYFRTGRARAAVAIREKMLRSATDFEQQKRQLVHLLSLFRAPKLYPMHQRYIRVTRHRYPAAFDDCKVQVAEQALLNNTALQFSQCSNSPSVNRAPMKAATSRAITATQPQQPQTTQTAVTESGQIARLQQRYRQQPSANNAFEVARALVRNGRISDMEPWAKLAIPAQQSTAQALQMMRQANSSGEASLARKLGALVLERNRFTRKEFLELNRITIKTEQRAGNKAGEREAWFRIYQASQDSNALLNVVRLHNDAGEHHQALKIINRIELDYLDHDGQSAWYDEMGETYFARHQYNNARYAQQKSLQIRPSAERWFVYAVTLYNLRELQEARVAIDNALGQSPDNSRYLVRKAQIANASNDTATARAILAEIAQSEPDDYEINANLALTEHASGNGSRASTAWSKALAALDTEKGAGNLSRLSVQSRLRSLENSWYVKAGSSACITDDTCRRLSDSIAAEAASRAYAGIDYQFNRHWRAGVEVEFTNEDNSLAPDADSMLAAVGFDYLPLNEQNLVISLDRTFSNQADVDDNTRVRITYDNQGRNGHQLPSGRLSEPYLYLGAELSQQLEGDKDSYAMVETRVGRQLQRSDHASITPYVFGKGDYYKGAEDDRSAVESGVGMRFSMEHDFNADGNSAETAIVLRAGRDLKESEDNEQFRTTIGIDFSY